jgi:heterodisulfide reductase subunit B
MKIGLYPGCSLTGSSREYNESVVAIAKRLGIELVEIPDWNCCGATAAHNLNKELSLALPTRILAIAEREGLDRIVVPCAACYSRLTVTQHELHENPILKSKISEKIELKYNGNVKILNVIQLIQEFGIDKIKEKITKPFSYKAACYYGCLLVRPPKILQFDRPEDPQTMDNIMKALGAESIEWNYKSECCGAAMSVAKTDIVNRLSGVIVDDATSRGADFIIVACPMCHSNLDMRRPSIEKYMGKKLPVPILYITQAIGLALGISETELGIQRHFVKVIMPEIKVVPKDEKVAKKKVEVKIEEEVEEI